MHRVDESFVAGDRERGTQVGVGGLPFGQPVTWYTATSSATM